MSAIFLHSTGSPPAMWDAAAAAAGLAGRAVAHTGYPPHAPIVRPRIVSAAEEVAHVLAQIGPDARDLHLVAHSYGGVIALDVAAALETAGRLAALTIFEPVLYGALAQLHDHPEAAALAVFERPEWTSSEVGGTDAWLARFIDYWNRPGSWDRMPEAMKASFRAVGWKMYSEVLTCFSPRLTFAHPVLARVPTRLLTAGRSPAPARAIVAELARRYPTIEVVDLPGVGHMAPITNAAVVGQALVRR
jgi:pimeloyl-ACP methyl ester carboxylesterase